MRKWRPQWWRDLSKVTHNAAQSRDSGFYFCCTLHFLGLLFLQFFFPFTLIAHHLMSQTAIVCSLRDSLSFWPKAELKKASSGLKSPEESDSEEESSSSRAHSQHPSCLPLACVGGRQDPGVAGCPGGNQCSAGRIFPLDPHPYLKPRSCQESRVLVPRTQGSSKNLLKSSFGGQGLPCGNKGYQESNSIPQNKLRNPKSQAPGWKQVSSPTLQG